MLSKTEAEVMVERKLDRTGSSWTSSKWEWERFSPTSWAVIARKQYYINEELVASIRLDPVPTQKRRHWYKQTGFKTWLAGWI